MLTIASPFWGGSDSALALIRLNHDLHEMAAKAIGQEVL